MLEFSGTRIFIMFGDRCNFHCRHCLQIGNSQDEDCQASSLFLSGLRSIAEKSEKRITLCPWGGEPLVYWDKIVYLVNEFGHLFDYSIISNGDLLNKDMVWFINDHNINFVLSNDGVNTDKVRDKNMLEDEKFCSLFSLINRKAFCSVVHSYNQDFNELFLYLKSKFDIGVGVEDLECTWSMPSDIYSFDFEKFKIDYRQFLNFFDYCVKNKILNREVLFVKGIVDKICSSDKFVSDFSNGDFFPYCSPRNFLNCDMSGNVYACHNFGYKIGTFDNSFDEVFLKYKELIKDRYSNKKCFECDVFSYCRGGCPFTKFSTLGVKETCEIKRIKYIEILKYLESFKG